MLGADRPSGAGAVLHRVAAQISDTAAAMMRAVGSTVPPGPYGATK